MAWEKGESGNPSGRPKGSRHKLAEAFTMALQDDWKEHGIAAIQQVRLADPGKYLDIIAKVIPKEVQVDVSEDVTAILQAVNDARRKRSAPPVATGMEPSGTGTVRH